MYSRISSGDIPGDEQNTDPWYMDYPDGLPRWTTFEFFVFASYSKHLEIQAIILNILSPFVDK